MSHTPEELKLIWELLDSILEKIIKIQKSQGLKEFKKYDDCNAVDVAVKWQKRKKLNKRYKTRYEAEKIFVLDYDISYLQGVDARVLFDIEKMM